MENFKRLSALMLASLFVMFIGFTSCSEDDDPVPTEKAYIGSAECQNCHQAIYDVFMESGHPYKLNKVENGQQPVIPFTTESGHDIPTPAGYTWADMTYLIGGYFWKARFVDTDGFIMTENDDTQYNFANQSQVTYHGDDPMGTKPYACGKCHTTGWVSVDDGAEPKDGLPGMAGDFFAGGIHCEECHGMGNIHAATEKAADIDLDNSSALCGKCHTRNVDNSIAASGGFIKHHEQYDEWLTSGGHFSSNIGCNSCHDPHASTVYNDIAAGEGIIKTCVECHGDYNSSNHIGDLDCITCHMPLAAKSAVKTGDYTGDVHSHMFVINPAADGTLFNAEGNLANPDGLGLSLDYVCYSCHKDADGLGGSNSVKTMEQLSAKATNFHGTK